MKSFQESLSEPDNEIKSEEQIADPADETQASLRILPQFIISSIVLLLIFGVSKSNLYGTHWVRRYLHRAVNATTMETFGVIAKSKIVRHLMENGRNMVRLEELTKQIYQTQANPTDGEIFQNWSWPLKGSVTRHFGWDNPSSGKTKQFFPGIEITAPASFTVNAVTSGQVEKIHQGQNGSWEIVIKHGQNWKSRYQNLDRIRVKVGQYVTSGEQLAQLASRSLNQDSKLIFELLKDNQPVDPLTVLVDY